MEFLRRALPQRRHLGHPSSRHIPSAAACSPSSWPSFWPSAASSALSSCPISTRASLWVRGTLEQSVGPDESIRVANQARLLLCSFPETTECTSQTGRPDDGTDHTGFFDTEYFVGLKPKEQWRPVFHGNKDNLIASMNLELEKKFPGVIWGFSQPIEDNMEEAVSGVKGELATKVYGSDLHTLEDLANQIDAVMSQVRGITDMGVLQVTGQPDLDVTVDRAKAARWGINVADVQDAIQTAVGGTALTQVLRGEEVYNLTLRYLPQYRNTQRGNREYSPFVAFGRARLPGPALRRARSRRRLGNLPRKQPALCRHQVQRARPRSGRRRARGHSEGERPGEAPARLSPWMGGRIPERIARRSAHGHHCAPHRAADLHHSLLHVQVAQVGVADSRHGGHGQHRRTAGAAGYRHRIQRFFGSRLPGALRRLRPVRRHHAGIHQSVARARQFH